ncbi:putative oleosin [Medicago truncatula]|uniref:Putative oleosin n=1 Tax=Medicago truncatula TaxID=3880 RepID=A0A396J7G9_MEDTR|nr:putative oleosin [Medicago truncatula]
MSHMSCPSSYDYPLWLFQLSLQLQYFNSLISSHQITMADHYYSIQPLTLKPPKPTTNSSSSSPLLRKHVSNSTQLFGLFTLFIVCTISLFLTCLTFVVTIMGFILFAPMIILLSPILVPVFAVLFVFIVGFLFTCGFGIVVLAMLSWIFRYFKGLHHHLGL